MTSEATNTPTMVPPAETTPVAPPTAEPAPKVRKPMSDEQKEKIRQTLLAKKQGKAPATPAAAPKKAKRKAKAKAKPAASALTEVDKEVGRLVLTYGLGAVNIALTAVVDRLKGKE